MNADEPSLVRNNTDEQCYEMEVDEYRAIAAYSLSGKTITFTHTEVPEEIGGRGVASQLIQAALEHCRSAGMTVVPQCQFVASYIERHPEYNSLISGKS